jgi:AcrR family transcriptional regulator
LKVEPGFRFSSIIGIVVPLETNSKVGANAPDEPERPRRADAVRNRALVLAAAEEVFAEQGLKAQIDEVARRAGVGVGTVCRNFPTKQSLLQAVFTDLYESMLDRARAALAEPDAASAFEQFLVSLPDFHVRHRAFAEQMANELEVAAMPVRDELMAAITELVTRAQQAGAVRADIGPADVSMLLSGVAHATALAGDLQPMLRERYVGIILDGLRTRDGSTLPGRAVSFAELRRAKQRRSK